MRRCLRQPYVMSQLLFPFRVALHFWPRFCIDDRRVKPFLRSFPAHPQDFSKDKVRTLWCAIHVWKLLLMLHYFTTRAWWILELSPWNMPEPSGKKKSIEGITCSFSTFRNSADSAVPRPDQLKQPRIITQQLADLNRNYDFILWPGSVSLVLILSYTGTLKISQWLVI